MHIISGLSMLDSMTIVKCSIDHRSVVRNNLLEYYIIHEGMCMFSAILSTLWPPFPQKIPKMDPFPSKAQNAIHIYYRKHWNLVARKMAFWALEGKGLE